MAEEKLVKPKDPVEIEYTEAAKHSKPGTRAVVHAELAAKLIAKGVAKKTGKKAEAEKK